MSIWKALENAILDESLVQTHQIIKKEFLLKEDELFNLRNNNTEAIRHLDKLIQNTSKEIFDTERYEPYIIGLFAVGMAVARCDGRIVEEEKKEIKNFIHFVSNSNLPQRYFDKIEAIKNMVFLNFNTAMTFVKQMDKKTWYVVDHLIALTIKADGQIMPQEIDFYRKWKNWLVAQE